MAKFCLFLLVFISGATFGGDAEGSTAKMYTIDLFSILSFALAIAAFFVSAFLGWLSWQFYMKSSEVSEKTNEAVSRVETSISGIQSDITEIVRRAVGYWVDGSGTNDSPEQIDDLNDKVEELRKQISTLGKGKPEAEDIEKKFEDLLSFQRNQLKNLNTSLFDAKVRSIFPSADKGPAVELTQNTTKNDKKAKEGQLIIEVTRPVKIATATGKFSPPFEDIPDLSVELESSPYGDGGDVVITSGVGKTSDFNVHLKSYEGLLKSGQYVVNYVAKDNA
ncbi:hypothetical protein [Halomonas sp. Mc5H-6]|uniref:hypothetical protein n=1 Tax=Halomonas sp. Mc5H-6 TaxID=2954500 RepID=UPI002097E981|nr:hypothetical protein [Halomonas sp. Mc5H-6]MCO7247745.1 hypothetical protein [Halomonas sp. Mc5H-6]